MKIFVTRNIPSSGIEALKGKGYEVVVSLEDRVLSKEEVIAALHADRYDAVLCLLTDKIDADVLAAAGEQCKVFANYAVGIDNIDVQAATERGIVITNTPGVLTNTVAEHAFALLLSISHRVAEADRFTRAGMYTGWAPMMLLGHDVSGKTLGIVGLGRIGSRVAHHAVVGFEMKVLYYDVKRNEEFEKEFSAEFREKADDVFQEADYISIHVPLLPTTKHMVDARLLSLMKKTAYLINTSRGPIVDEAALVEALRNNVISGAALDVYENEPALAPGLAELENVILTPHIASATEETRAAMSELAAKNIIEVLEGRTPPNFVKL
ncbi:MAG: D-glycerate dehydrogenase [Candidatus Sungbacteria bacterium]|nr:D-glycerate dehydrogenase [bacterium]MDZ4260479.1 D-glycerate dehydrogenase [Candidatus Sungbacteria bacterium]